MGRIGDYTNSVVYHIRFKDSHRVIYVGSTCKYNLRCSKHRYNCINEKSPNYNNQVYQFIREHGGLSAFEIVPVAYHACKDRLVLRYFEQAEMDKFDGLINSNCAVLDPEVHKEYNMKYQKAYRDSHKDKKQMESKTTKPSDKTQAVAPDSATKAKTTAKINCECGCVVSRSSIYAHRDTKKHADLLKSV